MSGYPRRIASLVPSLTETLVDLGVGDLLVAVTDWCGPALPDDLDPPRIGGVSDPDLDRLQAARPDLVVLGREENRREDWITLAEAGVRMLVVHSTSVTSAARCVGNLGTTVGRDAEGKRLRAAIESRRAEVLAAAGAPVRAVYPIWDDPWMTVGEGSYAAAILEDAGVELVGQASEDPYPTLDLDAAREAGPQIVLLPDEPFDFHGAAGDDLVTALTPAAGPPPVTMRVDGRLAAWYGSRSGQRLQQLVGILRQRQS